MHRALLTTDGTVTRLFEAYTLEKIASIVLDQSPDAPPAAVRWLEVPADTPTTSRRALLQGRQSNALYAYAETAFAASLLPEPLRRDIASGDESLGRLLQRHRFETRRDLLFFGMAPPTAEAPTGPLLARTYRILAGGRPLFVICEKFPLTTP